VNNTTYQLEKPVPGYIHKTLAGKPVVKYLKNNFLGYQVYVKASERDTPSTVLFLRNGIYCGKLEITVWQQMDCVGDVSIAEGGHPWDAESFLELRD